ncbi:MAG: hypothetical protein ACRDPA_04940 [Solirubrobacteraceae bacterium]
MSHIAYKLALIRRDQLLREAADRRLATNSTPPVENMTAARGSHRLSRRLEWLFRGSPRLTARGH